jgi:hypothetical protein
MPNFIKNILLYITGYAKIIILAGIGLFGFSIWSQWKASGDHAYTQREQLQLVSGHVKSASEIYVKGRRGRTTNKYYELDFLPKGGGETQKLRVSFGVPVGWVQNLIDEDVNALYDPSDSNLVYEATIEGQKPDLTYEGTRDRLLASAQNTANTFGGPLIWLASIGLIGIGAGGVVLRRKIVVNSAGSEEST